MLNFFSDIISESWGIYLFVIISYLFGSISGSIFLGKFKGIDVRKVGSGNAGATNALRAGGKFFALLVFCIDLFKGGIIILLLSCIDVSDDRIEIYKIFVGCAAVIGHVYPIFYGFKGGKGAATLIAVITFIYPDPIIFLSLVLSWIIIIVLTGYVGLSTMISGFIFMCITLFNNNFITPPSLFSIFACLFLLFTHRENIHRMLNGNENKFTKVMIFRKK